MEVDACQNPEEAATLFNNTILKVADFSIPKTKEFRQAIENHQPKLWRNKDCKKAEAIVKRTTEEAKKTTWSNFSFNLDPKQPPTKIYNFIARMNGNRIKSQEQGYPLEKEGVSLQTEKEKAEAVADAFEYPPEVSNSKLHRGQQSKSFPYQDDILKPFTKDELNMAIQKLKTPSTPGIDKEDNLWLIKSPEEFRTRILMGAILSTLILFMFKSDLKTSTTVDIRGIFADDLLTFHKSPNIEEASKSALITLDEIRQYSKDYGVPLSTEKTKVIVFHRKINIFNNPEMRISGRTLEGATSAKILGVHFGKRLTWQTHLEATKTSFLKRLVLMKRMAGISWGSSSKTLMDSYELYLRGMIFMESRLMVQHQKNTLEYLKPSRTQLL
ncbi:hypothetical protein QYM36_007750 [Artemia franciscana]|uniref:Reverse transcriptase domain-containing protein n=1 Tax=Artemia franciscana TaxID=6661 RepID=A0AA88LLU7_ARTSF|nr:hypothetical protein QYM36_007750 [Artemia franciscana]